MNNSLYLLIETHARSPVRIFVKALLQNVSVTVQNHKRVKGKFRPKKGHDDPDGVYSYSYTLSLTSALDGVGVKATPRPLYPRERDSVLIV